MLTKSAIVLMGLILAGSLALSPVAKAEEGSVVSTADGNMNVIQKYGKASYIFWPTGMHTEALSGNRAGKGTDLTFEHYLALGATLGNGFTLKFTNLLRQTVNEAPESEGKTFVWQDPYLTLIKSGLIKDEKHAINMDAYIRYYMPLSRPTTDGTNKGAFDDHGRGTVRLYVSPSKSFFDGKLTFNGTMLTNVKLNSLTPQERFDRATKEKALTGEGNLGKQVVSYRYDMYFLPDPSVAYTVSDKLELYLEYYVQFIHNTNGQWNARTDASSDQTLSPGVNWTPTKKILINPYLEYKISAAQSERKIDKAAIGVQMQYTFL